MMNGNVTIETVVTPWQPHENNNLADDLVTQSMMDFKVGA